MIFPISEECWAVSYFRIFLILSFRRVLYVVRFLLGVSPASEC